MKHEIKNFVKILQNYKNENFATTLCRSGVWGGGPVQPWRTLRANADCALFIFLLYSTVFHSVIYNSVCMMVLGGGMEMFLKIEFFVLLYITNFMNKLIFKDLKK